MLTQKKEHDARVINRLDMRSITIIITVYRCLRRLNDEFQMCEACLCSRVLVKDKTKMAMEPNNAAASSMMNIFIIIIIIKVALWPGSSFNLFNLR